VILLTRLGGALFALNPDLIERADCTPDTVVTLVNGTKYVVHESIADLATLVRDYRAGVLAASQRMDPDAPILTGAHEDGRLDQGSVVRLHRRET
jgi:flagellar protein FlbD